MLLLTVSAPPHHVSCPCLYYFYTLFIFVSIVWCVIANCFCNDNHWLGIVNFSYCQLSVALLSLLIYVLNYLHLEVGIFEISLLCKISFDVLFLIFFVLTEQERTYQLTKMLHAERVGYRLVAFCFDV